MNYDIGCCIKIYLSNRQFSVTSWRHWWLSDTFLERLFPRAPPTIGGSRWVESPMTDYLRYLPPVKAWWNSRSHRFLMRSFCGVFGVGEKSGWTDCFTRLKGLFYPLTTYINYIMNIEIYCITISSNGHPSAIPFGQLYVIQPTNRVVTFGHCDLTALPKLLYSKFQPSQSP